MARITKILLSFILFLVPFFSWAQRDVCNVSTFEPGAFTLSAAEICVGRPLSVIDNSGGSNVKYYYDYKGEDLSFLNSTANGNLSFTYTTANVREIRKATVVQIGQKAGKTMIACKEVLVRVSNQPLLSWSSCNDTSVEVIIPVDAVANDYDTFTLNLGGGFTPITIPKSSLPYKQVFTVPSLRSVPRTIQVRGTYIGKVPACTNSSSILVRGIPNLGNSSVDRPFGPNITRLELVTLNKAKVTYQGPINTPATLYGYERGNHTQVSKPIQQTINLGDTEINLPDATKVYCFYAIVPTGCPGVVQQSPEICTIPLTSVSIQAVGSRNDQVVWQPYAIGRMYGLVSTGPSTGNVYNNAQRLNRFQQGGPPPTSTTTVLPTGVSSRTVSNQNCKYENCYQVEHTISGVRNRINYSGVSISNVLCVNRFNVKPPAIGTLWVDANADKDLYEVHFSPTKLSPWNIPVESWRLNDVTAGTPVVVNPAGATALKIEDFRVPTAMTEYKISYTDACGSESLLSKSAYSVYLDHSKPATLKWQAKTAWSRDSLSGFEIVPLIEGTLNDDAPIITGIGPAIRQQSVNTGNYIDEAAYYIRAIPTNAANRTVSSIITRIPIVPNFYFPTAHTATNPFKMFGNKKRITGFTIKIYDRFGALVFKSEDPDFIWDNLYKGKKLSESEFRYVAEITVTGTPKIIKKGSFFYF